MNKIDPQLDETMTERMWRWVYALLAAAAQFAQKHNVPVETLNPRHGNWASHLMEQVMGDPTTRRKYYNFISPFHHNETWELMRLMSAFPYYTSEAVLSEKDIRQYLEEHYGYHVRFLAMSACGCEC